MAIEIVDLPIKKEMIFHSYVSLPEGMGNFENGARKQWIKLRGLWMFINRWEDPLYY